MLAFLFVVALQAGWRFAHGYRDRLTLRRLLLDTTAYFVGFYSGAATIYMWEYFDFHGVWQYLHSSGH